MLPPLLASPREKLLVCRVLLVPACCCRHLPALVLAAHAEQVALVVVVQFAIRAGHDEAVEEGLALGDGQAAADRRAQFAGQVPQPLHGRPGHGLGAGCAHGKAAIEHLGQHHQLCLARHAGELPLQLATVGLWLFPQQLGLHQGDGEFGHGVLSAARLTAVMVLTTSRKR